MAEVISQVVQSAQEPDAEAAAQALAEAAANAPTTQEEAQAQIDAEKAAVEGKARPDNVPEKFWDAEKGAVNHEALLASYAELEAKFSKGETEKKPEGEAEQKPEGETEKKPEGEPKKASEVVASLNERFAENGALSDEDYALAESIGHDRATVDAFIAGQKALAEEATRRITDAAGGKDTMDRMFAWASTTLKAEEIETFNKSFEGSDVNAAVIAMEQLKSKYEAANGREAKLVNGKPAGAAVDTFESWAQVSAAMSDPRYSNDPAYRAQVEAKVARSSPK